MIEQIDNIRFEKLFLTKLHLNRKLGDEAHWGFFTRTEKILFSNNEFHGK